MNSKPGKVYLVGAGPGDLGLVTQRALDLLGQAQVVFYDNLVNPVLLEKAPGDAQRVDVGKRGEGTSADQKEIEDRIVAAAREGKRVVRLKGGDPFIFGRGGEEAERLAEEGIPFEVVPGVSSPIAVPAYAGIPLTHRDFTHTVTFVTGHAEATLDWAALVKIGTLVFVMGVKTVRKNMEALLKAGKDPETPAALIRWGTYPRQQTFVGTVSTLADQVEGLHLMPPGIIVVGEAVRLREKINWYEKLPLFGKKILITRARSQASELSARFQELGADVIEIPTLEITPPSSWEELDRALKSLSDYGWILFTSVNGVNFFFGRLREKGMDVRDMAGCRLGAVGSATAAALENFFLKVDVIPEEFTGKALAKALPQAEVEGKKILIPRAKEGGEDLLKDLKSKGASVETVTAYQTRSSGAGLEKLNRLKRAGEIDLITFASSSAVKNFYDLLPSERRVEFLKRPCLCIGPVTAETAQEMGFQVAGVAERATLDSLLEKAAEYLKANLPQFL